MISLTALVVRFGLITVAVKISGSKQPNGDSVVLMVWNSSTSQQMQVGKQQKQKPYCSFHTGCFYKDTFFSENPRITFCNPSLIAQASVDTVWHLTQNQIEDLPVSFCKIKPFQHP